MGKRKIIKGFIEYSDLNPRLRPDDLSEEESEELMDNIFELIEILKPEQTTEPLPEKNLREYIEQELMGKMLSISESIFSTEHYYVEFHIPEGIFTQDLFVKFDFEYIDFEKNTMGATVEKEHWED